MVNKQDQKSMKTSIKNSRPLFFYSNEDKKLVLILENKVIQKELRQKMTPLKIRDVLIKSWVLSPENGPQ